MANIKSAQKKARKDVVRHTINLARKTSIKTAIKKVLTALEQGVSTEETSVLLRDAEAKIARAKNKGTLHANTAARKISRLAKRVATASK
ncbi:30S ribosomal protein S20 [Candidatus Dependentiae bacterium]|nr:30S ribosomal protein S20 [Candidatus Dependentiae bacterium]